MSPWLPPNECTAVTGGGRVCRVKVPIGSSRCRDHRPKWSRPHGRPRATPENWAAIRQDVLDRDPICMMCALWPSTTADHIIDRSAGGSDDMTNLQGLCHQCHSSKTARTRRRP